MSVTGLGEPSAHGKGIRMRRNLYELLDGVLVDERGIFRAVACVLLVAVIAAAGCRSVSHDRKAQVLEDEIATLTSIALANGSLTPQQAAAIAADGAKARSHAQELTK